MENVFEEILKRMEQENLTDEKPNTSLTSIS